MKPCRPHVWIYHAPRRVCSRCGLWQGWTFAKRVLPSALFLGLFSLCSCAEAPTEPSPSEFEGAWVIAENQHSLVGFLLVAGETAFASIEPEDIRGCCLSPEPPGGFCFYWEGIAEMRAEGIFGPPEGNVGNVPGALFLARIVGNDSLSIRAELGECLFSVMAGRLAR